MRLRRRRRKLRSILTTSFVLLVASATVGIAVTGELSADRMTDTLIAQRGRTALAGLEVRLDDSRRTKQIFAQLLAAEAPIVDAVAEGDPGRVTQHLVPLRARLGLQEIRAYGQSGQLLMHLAPPDDPWVDETLVAAARSGVTSSAVILVPDGLVVAAAAPVKGADGIVGSIIVARRFETGSFQELTGDSDIHLALFVDRQLLAVSDQLGEANLRWDPGYGNLATASGLVAERYSPVAVALDDERTMVALVDIGDVLLARQRRQILTIAGTLLVSGGAVLGGIRLSRRITRPVDTMMEVANTIAQGQYDERLPSYPIFELDALSRTINQLAADVDARETGQALALEELDRRFRSSFESATIGMALVSANGDFLAVNRALSDMMGRTAEELTGMNLVDVAARDDRDGLLVRLRELDSGAEPAIHATIRCLDADGRLIWANLGMVAVTDTDGNIRYHIAHIEDATARREAEIALTLSEQQWRLTFQGAAAGVALVEPDRGELREANQAACEMLRYGDNELTAMTIHDITHPDDREDWMREYSRVLEGEITNTGKKIRCIRGDGTTGHLLASLALVRDVEDKPLHMVAHFIDISEQVEAERRMADLLTSKDRLVASVSHELRTPLTAVVGYAQILNDAWSDLSTSEKKEMIESIAAEGVDLSNIIDDLLVAARAESGQLIVQHSSLDLGSQVDQVFAATRGFDGRTVDFDGRSARVIGDPSRVRQIIRNLFTNAIRYGGDHIAIEVVELVDAVELVVSDNGPGVPEARRQAIFEPYQRAHQREGLTASVGLGLTVSRQLAILMGGDLAYRYEEGRSQFSLTLQPDLEWSRAEPSTAA